MDPALLADSFSALDDYFGAPAAPLRFLYFEGDLVGLARAVDSLSFSAPPYADALDDGREPRLRIRCAEGEAGHAFPQARLRRTGGKRGFYARGGVYESLAAKEVEPDRGDAATILFDAAALAARYGYRPKGPFACPDQDPGAAYQRDLLDLVVTGKNPGAGLEILAASGFLARYWPEIDSLRSVDHVKDYHPEGDAWRHTLETFEHRKAPDPTLSLALLLHDTGKPDAVENEGRRFDRHSELGERTARSFLRRLAYPESTVRDVAFLVRYHMLPAALPRIPPTGIADTLENELFPVLLELYRCDELSTYRGPDGYFQACAAYKAYLKNNKNPYRSADGKKRRGSGA